MIDTQLTWLTPLMQPLTWPWANGTLEFRWPLLWLLAPLPLMLTWRLSPYASHFEALHAPFFNDMIRALQLTAQGSAVVLRRGFIERFAGVLAWLLLLIAASVPSWVEPPQTKILPARDLLLALDISQSMEARDFPSRTAQGANQNIERLAGARQALADFITRRPTDRLGLVVFANGAHLAVPFTLDHALLTDMLDQLATGMAGPRTLIGDAIGLGIHLFEGSRAPTKTLILLTDGADTGSRIPPEAAARLAHERKITVHTIALGQPGNAVDKVDTVALRAIADITGGRFALASKLDDLYAVYEGLDALETQNHQQLTHRARHSLYHWPLGAALLVFVLGQVLAALISVYRQYRQSRQAPRHV
jgi:Ca-activated chloride channel homolog